MFFSGKIKIALFLFLGCFQGLFAQNLPEGIRSATDKFVKTKQLDYAITSFSVLNAETGESVFLLNENTGLAPASTLKSLTAITAYYLLGKDFTYQTRLMYSGKIVEDILHGDIIIRGAGDPTLGSWRFPETKTDKVLEEWVNAIKQLGIKSIDGRIIGDDSTFDTQTTPGGWSWVDMGNYYGAGNSGLSWRENQYDLLLLPGNTKDEPVKIRGTHPDNISLRFVNELKTGAKNSGDQTYIYAAPYGDIAYLRGTSPAQKPDFQVSGSIPDPGLFAANTLRETLQKNGIQINKPADTYRLMTSNQQQLPTELNLITTHTSPNLKEINHHFMKKSINLYGEHLVKTLALQDGEEKGSTQKGLKVIKDFWENRGIDPESLHLSDGSGLSPGNRLTSLSLAKIMQSVKKEEWFDDFHENLPVIHNIRMKSGNIGGVVGYTGYLTTKSGTPLVFSIMVNNYSGYLSPVRNRIFNLLDEVKAL